MKIVILLFFFSFAYSSVKAQDFADIKEFKPKDYHIISECNDCDYCNYPQVYPTKSWFDGGVIEFTTSKHTTTFLRFYTEDSQGHKYPCGHWMIPEEDICRSGMLPSMKEIKDILVLEYVPKYIVEVHVPKGTAMLEGRIYGSTCETCRQFCLLGDLNCSYYVDYTGYPDCTSGSY
jgi:hypothetical protein